MYPDGTLVKGPKALCELQGYVFNAWMRMAEVLMRSASPNARRNCGPAGGFVRAVQRGFLG